MISALGKVSWKVGLKDQAYLLDSLVSIKLAINVDPVVLREDFKRSNWLLLWEKSLWVAFSISNPSFPFNL